MTKSISKPIPMPSQERLRELFDYEPDTGVLTWRYRPERTGQWNARWAGRPALNALHSAGYKHGCIDYTYFFAHRIIWKWLTGNEPPEIDHDNGVRNDNREENLVPSDTKANSKNMALSKRNTSGVSGVHWIKPRNKWAARITFNGKLIELGAFVSLENAISARRAKEVELGFSKRHGAPLPPI